MTLNLLDKKLNYWEHQLLDLGKRNKMINYRETKRTTMKLVEPSFDELFNRLAINEEKLTFQRPVDRETDLRVFSILSLLENMSSPLPVTIGDIKAEGSILERQRTLKHMRSKARLSQEEQGTNILYVSFGFIEWRDGKGASAQWIKSPLILVPAVLTLDALNSPFSLSKHEDDIVVNPTLEYYFKTEYGIELPSFDADKETLDDYLESLEVIADQRGWRIIKEVSLGLLSFLKISMYNDLLRNEERIKKNPVIRAMAGDSTDANNIPDELASFVLDSIKTRDCYQVMSADSSQQNAILYSKKNISFVMQGPPGTGKSQTITNIIAEALADGKKVLFVSEKMAALQVVYRRLQDACLSDFCLPLHSYKANKKEILEQIGANLNLKQTTVRDSAMTSLDELWAIRNELNNYAVQLHEQTSELNASCYEIYNRLENVYDAPSLTFRFRDVLGITQSDLQACLNALKEYALSVNRLNRFIMDNPWEGLSSRISGHEYSEKMKSLLGQLTKSLTALYDMILSIDTNCELPIHIRYSDIPSLIYTLQKVSELPNLPESCLTETDMSGMISSAKEAKSMYNEIASLQADIDNTFKETIYEYNYNEWKRKLLVNAEGFVGMPFIDNSDADYFIRNITPLYKNISVLRDALSVINDSFVDINEMLGLDITPNLSMHKNASDLYALIKDNIILPPNWFSADLSKLKALISTAKNKASEEKRLKGVLLEKWEPEILSLDYSPMLIRYKTDYTSIFKVFNSQYRQDKKKIQSLSKNIIKKLVDDMAVDLLNTLKEYHENADWFQSNSNELQDNLGIYYNGIDTEWNTILTYIHVTEEILKLPSYMISKKVIEALSVDHTEILDKLNLKLSAVSEAFFTVKQCITDNQFKIDVDSNEFNAAEHLATAHEYISKLDILSAQKDLIVPHLENIDENLETIYSTIEKLNSYNNINNILIPLQSNYKKLFGYLYCGSNTDWDNVISLVESVIIIKQSPIYKYVCHILNESSEKKKEWGNLSSRMAEEYNKHHNDYIWIKQQFSDELDSLDVVTLNKQMVSCLNNIDILDGWIDYQEAKEICRKLELDDLIVKIEEAELFDDVERIFLKGFYYMWLGAVCAKSDSVRRFRRTTHDERIKKFIELDDLQLKIAQMRIREKLIKNLPSTNRMLRATDEVAILNKELSKRRNIMPLRKLFRLIPNLLMKLKPCLMMSPLSVSYFLETEAYHFDLVIFDEASQIFPEDAIGAIFRGSQVIIAGDSKQLPPTNFFAATTNNFDGDYDIDDEEDYSEIVSDSILEEAASVLPNRTLLWHYRSKHENLIAFSNREIYKNNLITFPNSITNLPDMGVEYIYVEDGRYEGGGKNCNIREAQKCVMLVLKHIQKHPDRSLGIIAFSEKQQTAIENAIIDFRERMPEYEWFFDESRDEPFFVKNLENVQGDERDTIIFSICYAKDKNGKMYMRFGPLGHEGGERRLNVAITRAKCNIKLVGSILPSDIDLNRTNSEGVRMLRSYIEFARKGTTALRPVEKKEGYDTEDEFCKTVASFLTENGYKIKTNVGCSDYKIDIAIESPTTEGEFIAGIECDGLSYVHAKTARDRDHLRKTVLKNMGWNLYRVWSTEWYRNPEAEKATLLNFVESLFNENGEANHSIKQSNEQTTDVSLDEIATETTKTVKKVSSENPYGFSYYTEGVWSNVKRSGSSDNLTRISENVIHFVNAEEPIHMDVLYKRLGPSFTTGKATEGVKATIDEAIKKKLKGRVVIDEDNFIRTFPIKPVSIRIPREGETPRPMEYIHTEEVAAAMIKIISETYGITEEDLITETARVFGFERKGPKIKAKANSAIKYLVNTKKVKIIDNKVQLIGD